MKPSVSVYVGIWVLAIVGCSTPPEPMGTEAAKDVCVRPPQTDVAVKTAFGGEKTVADSKIKITYDDRGLQDVAIADPNTDMRDFQAFAITAYRQTLQRKLEEGKPLTRGEIDMLKFVCLVQHITFAAITAYGYEALTTPHIKDTSIAKDFSVKSQSEDVSMFGRAVENFAKNGNVLSRLINIWSQDATLPEAKDIFKEIVSPQYGKKTNDSKFVSPSPDDFFACKMAGVCASGGALGGGLIAGPVGAAASAVGGVAVGVGHGVYSGWKNDGAGDPSKKDGEYTGDEYSYSRLFNQYTNVKVLNNKQKALLWGQVADSLRFYSQDLGDLHRDMGTCIKKTQDSYTKREVEDLRIQYSMWCEEDFYKFREVYYAYPFISACKKLYENIQDARRLFWVNDKTQISDATMLFCETTSVKNNEMIKNLNSRYAAKVYGDTLIELKKRAGDSVFKEIQEKCRLWSLDEPEFELGDEVFGRRKVKYQTKVK